MTFLRPPGSSLSVPQPHTSGLGQFQAHQCHPGLVQGCGSSHRLPILRLCRAVIFTVSNACKRDPPTRLFYSASTFPSSQTRLRSRHNASVWVVYLVARFFYRETDEIQWSRGFQSVVKRPPIWPHGEGSFPIGQLSACHNARLYQQFIESGPFFVTKAVRLGSMIGISGR
jgi:hypothetical protein